MKIAPPIVLIPYIDFKDGKVVAAKPIPNRLQKRFDKFCKDFENTKERHKQRFYKIPE